MGLVARVGNIKHDIVVQRRKVPRREGGEGRGGGGGRGEERKEEEPSRGVVACGVGDLTTDVAVVIVITRDQIPKEGRHDEDVERRWREEKEEEMEQMQREGKEREEEGPLGLEASVAVDIVESVIEARIELMLHSAIIPEREERRGRRRRETQSEEERER